MNNLVQLAGTLAEMPTIQQLTDGTYLLENSLRMYPTVNGRRFHHNSLQYIPIRALGSVAQEIEKHFSRDSQIMIRGELRNHPMQDEGEKGFRMVVQIFEFVALGKPKERSIAPRYHTKED